MSARNLGILALAVVCAGAAFLAAYATISQAATATFHPHDRFASGIPYFLGVAQRSYTETDYGAEHAAAIDMWNAATPWNFIVECINDPCDNRQFVVNTNSTLDNNLGVLFGEMSCQDWTEVEGGAILLTVRAFAFGHTPAEGLGDNKFTFVCLNDSALVNCSACFDDFDGPGVTTVQKRGIAHEMGHTLHLGHNFKGVMDTAWNKDVIALEANYVVFAYVIGHESHRVRTEVDLPSQSPGYFECITNSDWDDLDPGDITMRVYCYVDIPGVPVNPAAGPAAGDGLPGAPPPGPFAAVGNTHAELDGLVDAAGLVTVSGCFEDSGQAALGNVYVDWFWDAETGIGTADTWVNQSANDCLNGPPGAADSSGALDLVDESFALNLDSDGDGCTDKQELGDDPAAGGLRDPFNPFDCGAAFGFTGNLSGTFDLLVHDGTKAQQFFYCKTRVDHDPAVSVDTGEGLKTASTCFTDVPGQGDLNSLILPDPNIDLAGPPPPPPYGEAGPQTGWGSYCPVGSGGCLNVLGGIMAEDSSFTVT